MRNPILAIAIAFVVVAPCTVASAQSYQAYVKTEATKQGKFKGETQPPTNQPRQITPGWNTCTSGACPSPLTTTNPALKGNALSPSPKAGYDLKANRKM